MNKTRLLSAVALTSLAASLVACQTGPLLQPGTQNPALLGAQSAPRTMTSARGAELKAAAQRGLTAMPGEYIVRMKSGASAAAAFSQGGLRAMNLQAQPVGNPALGINLVRSASLRAAGTNDGGQTLAALRSNPAVLYAEPNVIVKLNLPAATEPAPRETAPQAFPNDPMFEKQYAHQKIQSQKGWEIEQGNKDLILAIVDTGVDYKHPDLAAKLLPGYNTVDGNATVEDGNGHGTHCAGIASAITNNGVGVAGVAPNVKVLPVQVLSKEGYGSYESVANGIIWAADHGAKVISMSLGGPSSSAVITDAVNHALSKDAMLIAAMGNDGNSSVSYPAGVPGVMAVGATDSNDKIARFSQYGKHNSVAAPGVNILSTFPTYATGMPGISYGSISGTSMATPAVSGLAALVRSKYPQLNAAQVKAHIEATSDDLGTPGFDVYYGHGRINVFKAMSTAPGAVRR
jgi:subtilisin family serine protease